MAAKKRAPRSGDFTKGRSGDFKKGDDPRRNAGGRPKGTPNITNLVIKVLMLPAGEKFKPVTKAEKLAYEIVLRAQEGGACALKQLWDRLDGPVKEEQEHSGGLTIQVQYADPDADPS